MARREYYVEDVGGESEQAIRDYLLEESDVLRLTRHPWTEIGFLWVRRRASDKDPLFIETRKRLEPFLIRKALSNTRYNDIQQKDMSEHYYLYLVKEVREMVSRETVIWCHGIGNPRHFYGFEDPVFYKGDEMIGCIISHERMAILYLTDADARSLKKKGIKLHPAYPKQA